MSDSESIKKMLRSVLQSSKDGVSILKLQSEYRSLCGETIPLRKLGFTNLEDYLRSIPSVVRMDYRNADLRCFAAVCSETAHIAQLVARQKSTKKSGCSQFVNCRMRRKDSEPYVNRGWPMSSLRQPSAGGAFRPANRFQLHGGYRGFSASGDVRLASQCFSPPIPHRQPAPQPSVKQSAVPNWAKNLVIPQKTKEKPHEQVSGTNNSEPTLLDKTVVQERLIQLLSKYCSGLWMSKLPTIFSEMFGQQLPPQMTSELEKWTHICKVEKSCSAKGDFLVYPILPSSTASARSLSEGPSKSPIRSSMMSTLNSSQVSTSAPLRAHSVSKPPAGPGEALAKPAIGSAPQSTNHFTSSKMSQNLCNSHTVSSSNANLVSTAVNGEPNSYSVAPMGNYPPKTNPPALTPSCHFRSEDLPPQKSTLSLNSVSSPGPPVESCAAVLPADVCYRIKELLSKYSNGLWVHALPKLFMDAYKAPFPEHFMDKLSLLPDLCTVEYPIPHDSKKAILFKPFREKLEDTESNGSQKSRRHHLPSGLEVTGPVVPPCLVHPSVQYPSVLITEAKSSNAVTVRYVGDGYSKALEAMEDAMHALYKQNSTLQPLSQLAVGQLVAVKGENGNELTRAQVTEVTNANIKVYYVDHGFTVEIPRESLLELHHDFLSLPFQATIVRMAGLEAFSSHPSVLSSLETFAVGKIMLMEILASTSPNDLPEVLIYDTSQDDDININSLCLKELQDQTMNNPLTVNSTYRGVCVTNICVDGIIFCQLPSRGTTRLNKLLEETKAFLLSQMTSEYLVSQPFIGKMCLTCYKDKWCRVEITNLHGNRVMEVVLIDLGVSATVEVTELREIPPLFLRDFALIPPQAIRCRLVDVMIPEGEWSLDVVSWLKNAVLGVEDCKMKIFKLEEHKEGRLVHMYLFVHADHEDVHQSINHKLSNPEVWQTLNSNRSFTATGNGSVSIKRLDVSSPTYLHSQLFESSSVETTPTMPPTLALPLPGQNMDVHIPAACHPGYFVLQLWQDLHKLVMLMGEMMLHYNQTVTPTDVQIKKGDIYAAKINKSWYRAVVKGILSNGLISVYELDHGKHELIRRSFLQPLIEEFRQLPFQAIIAQLAGVPKCQWSEEASLVFRNHVEKQALVAQIESVQDESEVQEELWERKLTVYLVDTQVEDKDVWIHTLMADFCSETSSPL
ncbi:tudor domain-containing protein 7A isoform X1 [Syngnathus scovelli]|uniref:tudor domain-containing protein 7A isoform X1 n=1 Tax=Syngnathus scovelli TaxID=161590 RepID=UPI002110C712|nr:tudor domain-containing protein 7A isoform X1 [Syngnathus scovelli]